MSRCAFIRPGGDRCRSTAMRGYDVCYAHRPDLAAERKRHAQLGGRMGGRGRPNKELTQIKREIKGVIKAVLMGELETGPAAVSLQGLNTLLRALEVERRTFDMSDLLERIEQVEERA